MCFGYDYDYHLGYLEGNGGMHFEIVYYHFDDLDNENLRAIVQSRAQLDELIRGYEAQ
jgi:hypothetical protein